MHVKIAFSASEGPSQLATQEENGVPASAQVAKHAYPSTHIWLFLQAMSGSQQAVAAHDVHVDRPGAHVDARHAPAAHSLEQQSALAAQLVPAPVQGAGPQTGIFSAWQILEQQASALRLAPALRRGGVPAVRRASRLARGCAAGSHALSPGRGRE